jgi:hypothetical protein
MELIWQDVAVTSIAVVAAVVLMARVRKMFASSAKPGCDACPHCEGEHAQRATSQAQT